MDEQRKIFQITDYGQVKRKNVSKKSPGRSVQGAETKPQCCAPAEKIWFVEDLGQVSEVGR